MPGQLEGVRATIALRVIETTDLHGYVQGYDYFTDRPQPEVGLARLSSLIAEARAEASNSLLFDNGDFLQGTPLTEYWARVRGLAEGETHPVIAAMNALDYDAVTPGNHEFNYGLDFMRRAVAGARFPLVCANALIAPPGTDNAPRTLLPPWVVLERDCLDQTGTPHRLRIGVIGFLPPQTAAWDVALLDGQLWTTEIVETARASLPALRAAGVDLVIALAHTGIAATPPAGSGEAPAEHAALPLAALDGIDVLLCGHSHLCFPGPGNPASPGIDPARGTLHGKPAMNPGRWGSHLGVMDLRLDLTPEGWRLTDFATELRPACTPAPGGHCLPRLPEDPAILQINTAAHTETLRYIRRDVGHLSVPLHSYFSLVAPDAGLALVAQAQAAHVARCLAGRPEARLPLLSAAAPFKCGGRGGPNFFLDLAPGPLRMSHISDLYVFPNTVAALEVTGAELADWLERSAGVFAQITPGRSDQPLLDPDFPCYNFDVITGLSYEIDLSQPARFTPEGLLNAPQARRIVNLRHDGRPVQADQRFVVATNNYRSSGAGHFAGTQRPDLDLGPALSLHQALVALAKQQTSLTPAPLPIWRFRPMPATSAVFETSPRALAHLGAHPDLRIEPLRLDDTGFQQIRLHF